MRTGVDTNVFSRMWLGGERAELAEKLLLRCASQGSLVISPIVYAETLANPMLVEGQPEKFLAETGVAVDFALNERVWREAGHRFGRYARRKRVSGGGEARRLMADFLVGAHALLQADRLLTFDARCFRIDFPELPLVPLEQPATESRQE